ncbi:MAG: hypothetical protein LBT27_05955 [Prevotellaceae bacterium]|jgi:hypothetical protein|nr:hypothetical protein [Prevotellaceae bacterium]
MKYVIIVLLCFVCISINAQSRQNKVQNANEYIASKFQNYDIVILGEHHWNKNQLSFLKQNIPLLYKNGVRCFAFEYLAFTAQDKIDRLIAADKFSEPLRDSIISEKSHWFIKEYMNILYVLWKINRSNKEKIKVLGLDLPLCFPNYNSIDNDSVMAENIIKYYSKTQDKMLIYCGANHIFTKEHMCTRKGNVVRMGNLVYQNFFDKVTNIVLFPLIYEDKNEEWHYISYKNKKKVFGMDIKNSPVSNNTIGSYYLQQCKNYSWGNFYDGAIFINKKVKFCKIYKKLSKEDRSHFYEIQSILKRTKATSINE